MLAQMPLLGTINHLLRQAHWAPARLKPFAGRHVRISAPPFGARLRIAEDGLLAEADGDAAPDVEIVLPAHTPFLLLGGTDQIMKAAHISGAADFAEAVGFVLANLRWDAEEDLARVIGDVAARRAVDTAGRLTGWQRQAAANLVENLAEYLTEEKPLLAKRRDLAALTADIQQAEEALAILDRRVRRLEN